MPWRCGCNAEAKRYGTTRPRWIVGMLILSLSVFVCTCQMHRTDAESAGEAMEINQVTGAIIGAAIEGQRALGPGLLASAYEASIWR